MEKYYKDVKKALVCMPKAKREILKQLKCGVENYIGDHPDCTRADIEAHFGTPQSIAAENAASNGVDYKKRLRLNKAVKITAAVAMLLALAYALTVCIGSLISNNEDDVYYYEIILVENSTVN